MRIAKNFFKKVPVEKRSIVQERLKEFAEIIPTSKTLSDIPKGFWIRKIAGTEILKFRVNSGDRILFEYDENNEICFLSFQTHDNQVLAARTKHNTELEDFVIDTNEYIENSLDQYIDYHAKYELQAKLNQLRQDIVVENEDITLIIEDQLFDEENFLTLEQFEVLTEHDDVSVILGCAGSGKTSIGIRKIMLNQELERDSIYLTKSKFLNNQIEKDFLNISKTKKGISFYSLQSFYEALLGKEFNVIYYPEFMNWYNENNLDNSEMDISPDNIFLEVNSILKGSIAKDRIMKKKDYLKSESHFNNYEKKYVYHIASLYQKWLSDNNYYDLNDLAKLIDNFDTLNKDIIIDEVQNFTQVQLNSILKLKSGSNNIMLFGDDFQTTQNYTFSLSNLTAIINEHNYRFHVSYLSENFRSGDETVELLNKIKKNKNNYQELSTYLEEKAIRRGQKPKALFSSTDPE